MAQWLERHDFCLLIGDFFWLLLQYWGNQRNGLCIEFRYSNSSPSLFKMTLKGIHNMMDGWYF